MRDKKKLTQAELRRVLHYNPLTGSFIWRISLNNRIRVSDIAGRVSQHRKYSQVYRVIGIKGHKYAAHHLAFLYIKGHWPRDQIDHKDGNGLNNCWLNLRECTQSQNQANRGPTKNNKLGTKGVYKKNGRYYAKIMVNGKVINIGQFDALETAAQAYRKTATKHFGEFASWE